MKRALVLGAGGFIGHHLVNRLKQEGYWVRGVDLKKPKYEETKADEFIIKDLTVQMNWPFLVDYSYPEKRFFDEIYQLAADMGGAGYVFTGDNDADIMYNSVMINLNLLKTVANFCPESQIFYSSSACVYPKDRQPDKDNKFNLKEEMAYPANPDSEYGWEKLFSERLYLSFIKNYNLNIRIARFHNIFGPMGSWNNGKEKSPAAICRKIIHTNSQDFMEIWGDGTQIRSYLYIDDCLDAIKLLMNSSYIFPINIGSEFWLSIETLIRMILEFESKLYKVNYKMGPIGVQARTSDNRLVEQNLGWIHKVPLAVGLRNTYFWIKSEIEKGNKDED